MRPKTLKIAYPTVINSRSQTFINALWIYVGESDGNFFRLNSSAINENVILLDNSSK